jgi:hypothetical protein
MHQPQLASQGHEDQAIDRHQARSAILDVDQQIHPLTKEGRHVGGAGWGFAFGRLYWP